MAPLSQPALLAALRGVENAAIRPTPSDNQTENGSPFKTDSSTLSIVHRAEAALVTATHQLHLQEDHSGISSPSRQSLSTVNIPSFEQLVHDGVETARRLEIEASAAQQSDLQYRMLSRPGLLREQSSIWLGGCILEVSTEDEDYEDITASGVETVLHALSSEKGLQSEAHCPLQLELLTLSQPSTKSGASSSPTSCLNSCTQVLEEPLSPTFQHTPFAACNEGQQAVPADLSNAAGLQRDNVDRIGIDASAIEQASNAAGDLSSTTDFKCGLSSLHIAGPQNSRRSSFNIVKDLTKPDQDQAVYTSLEPSWQLDKEHSPTTPRVKIDETHLITSRPKGRPSGFASPQKPCTLLGCGEFNNMESTLISPSHSQASLTVEALNSTRPSLANQLQSKATSGNMKQHYNVLPSLPITKAVSVASAEALQELLHSKLQSHTPAASLRSTRSTAAAELLSAGSLPSGLHKDLQRPSNSNHCSPRSLQTAPVLHAPETQHFADPASSLCEQGAANIQRSQQILIQALPGTAKTYSKQTYSSTTGTLTSSSHSTHQMRTASNSSDCSAVSEPSSTDDSNSSSSSASQLNLARGTLEYNPGTTSLMHKASRGPDGKVAIQGLRPEMSALLRQATTASTTAAAAGTSQVPPVYHATQHAAAAASTTAASTSHASVSSDIGSVGMSQGYVHHDKSHVQPMHGARTGHSSLQQWQPLHGNQQSPRRTQAEGMPDPAKHCATRNGHQGGSSNSSSHTSPQRVIQAGRTGNASGVALAHVLPCGDSPVHSCHNSPRSTQPDDASHLYLITDAPSSTTSLPPSLARAEAFLDRYHKASKQHTSCHVNSVMPCHKGAVSVPGLVEYVGVSSSHDELVRARRSARAVPHRK